MKNLLKKINSYFFCAFIFAILLAAVLLPYYSNGNIILGGEGNYVLDFNVLLGKLNYTWQNWGVGFPATSSNYNYFIVFFFAFLQKIIPDIQVVNFIFIFILYFLPFFSALLVCRVLNLKPFLSFLISYFYVVNPFSLYYLGTWVNHWNSLVLFIIPLYFFIIFKYYEKNKLLFLFFGLNSALCAFTNANPPLMVVNQISIIISLVFTGIYKDPNFSFNKFAKKYFVVLTSFFLFNIWWILNWMSVMVDIPQMYSTGFALGWADSFKIFPNLIWRNFTFTSLFPINFSVDFVINLYSSNFSFLIVTIPIIIVIYFVMKYKSYSPVVKFLLVCILITLFLMKGILPPFGFIYKFMIIYIPFFSVFKTPIEKWGVLYLFLFILLFIILLKDNDKKKEYKFLLGLFLFYLSYVSFPFVTSKFISDYKMFDGNIATRKYIDKKEYKDLRKNLSNDPVDYRVFSLPGSLNYQIALTMPNDKFYTGMDPVLNSINRQFIAQYSNTLINNFDVLYDNISSEKFSRLLALYNIGAIVLNRDILPWFGFKEKEEMQDLENIFNNEKIYKKEQLIPGTVSLYKLQNEHFLPHIYSSASIVPIVGKNRSLSSLTYTTYLDSYPAIAFTSQVLEKGNFEKIIKDNILFVNSQLSDLALDFVDKNKSLQLLLDEQGQAEFKIKQSAIYEVLVQFKSSVSDKNDKTLILIVDNNILPLPGNCFQNQQWIRFESVSLNKGKHRIRVFFRNDRGKIESIKIVPQKMMQQILNETDVSFKNNEIQTTYLFYKDETYFQEQNDKYRWNILKPSNYKIKMILSPKAEFIKQKDTEKDTFWHLTDFNENILNADMQKHKSIGTNSSNVFSENDENIPLSVNLDWNHNNEKSEKIIQKSFKNLKLNNLPYFSMIFKKDDSVKDVAIKFFVSKYKNGFLKKSFTLENQYSNHFFISSTQTFIADIYKEAVKVLRLPVDADCFLMKIEISVIRVKKGEYKILSPHKFEIYNAEFHTELPFIIENSPLDEKKLQGKGIDTLSEISFGKDKILKLQLETKSYVDLKTDSQLRMIFKKPEEKIKSRENLKNLRLLLDLDFDGDGKSDKKAEYEVPIMLIQSDYVMIYFDVYDAVKSEFPGKKNYHLNALKISKNSDIDKKWYNTPIVVSRTWLKKKLIDCKDWNMSAPIFELNNKKYYLKNMNMKKMENGKLYLEIDSIYFPKGEHLFSTIVNSQWQVNFAEIEPVSIDVENKWKNSDNLHLPKISFKKINTTKYVVDVETSKPWTLVFSEAYHPKWEAFINGETVSSKNHFVVNGYANGFCIDKTGKYQIVIEYATQKYFNIGLIVSAITLLSCVGYLVVRKRSGKLLL